MAAPVSSSKSCCGCWPFKKAQPSQERGPRDTALVKTQPLHADRLGKTQAAADGALGKVQANV